MLNCLERALGVIFGCWGWLCLSSALVCDELSHQIQPWFQLWAIWGHSTCPGDSHTAFLLVNSLIAALGKEQCCIHEWEGAHCNGCNGPCKWGCFGETLRRLFLQQRIGTRIGELLPLNFTKIHLTVWISTCIAILNPGSCFCKFFVGRKAKRKVLSRPSHLQKWQQRTRPLVANDSTRQQEHQYSNSCA